MGFGRVVVDRRRPRCHPLRGVRTSTARRLGARTAAANRDRHRPCVRCRGRRLRARRRARLDHDHHRIARTTRTSGGRVVNRLRRAFVAVTAGLALATFVGVGTAFAHAELLTSDPQPGAVLDASPAHVTLTFNEPVESSLGAIRVFDGTGNSIDVSAARHPDGDSSKVEIDLPKLADGSYVVDWRVVSADSHPVHAAYTFQVGPKSTLAAGLLDQILGNSHTGKSASLGLTVSRSLVTSSIAIVFGGLLAFGLGIVPFGRRQKWFIGSAA